MKTFIKFISIALCTAIMFSACEQTPSRVVSFVETDTVPVITFETPNNLFLAQGSVSTVNVNTNIPVYSASGKDESRNVSVSLNLASGLISATKEKEYTLQVLRRGTYTEDTQMYLIQNLWTDRIINYVNYGYVEKELNIRVFGTAGQRHIDFSDLSNTDLNKPGEWYYMLGTVKEIKTLDNKAEKRFVTYDKSVGAYGDYSKTPIGYFNVQYAEMTIENEDGEFTFSVYGDTRDNEFNDFLNYVKVGYYVEVPAIFSSTENLKKGIFNEIRTNQVYVSLIPQELM